MNSAVAKALSPSRERVGRGAAFILAATLALTACTYEPQPPPAANNAEPVAAPSRPPAAAPSTAPAPATATALTAEGWEPLKIGMTRAEITAALGPDANPEAVGGPEPEACDQYRPARGPQGMLVMVEDGRLTRISLIRAAKVKTDRGLGLGVPATAVRAAYGAKVQSTPHKYGDPPQEYLTVWAKGGGPADRLVPENSRGIQYEVNESGKVCAIHAGGPSILYVEGCS